MKNQRAAISEGLFFALKVCQELSINGLVDLALFMSKHPDSEDKTAWVTAIAVVAEGKCPSRSKFSLN